MECFAQGERRLPGDPVRQSLALDELAHRERHVAVAADVVGPEYDRVSEAGQDLGFFLLPLAFGLREHVALDHVHGQPRVKIWSDPDRCHIMFTDSGPGIPKAVAEKVFEPQCPTRVAVRFRGKSGQVVLDQIRTVDRARLVKLVGRIPDSTAREVLSVLGEMFARQKRLAHGASSLDRSSSAVYNRMR